MKVARILALMENPLHRSALLDCLEEVGREVVTVESSEQARAALQEDAFDLIVAEVQFDDRCHTVLDFLKWTKSNLNLKAIPFLVINIEQPPAAKKYGAEFEKKARFLGAAGYFCLETLAPLQLRQLILAQLPGGAILPAFWELSC